MRVGILGVSMDDLVITPVGQVVGTIGRKTLRKNNKAYGDKRERQVKEKLVFDGWEVRKARMSFGAADLLAKNLYTGERMLVQVKGNKGSPYQSFGPADRKALLEDAGFAGASAWLAHWPPRGELKWYESKVWP